VGKPLPGVTVRIVDESSASVGAGEHGEIVVSGATVFAGYLNVPESRTLRDRELFTGDVGYLDADGDLWLVDRRSDLIVSGGENVYPAEVENVLREHPAVGDVCVVGTPDVEWGARVAAAVVLRPGMRVSADELLAFGRARLAGYKQPRRIVFVNALPQTASGKVQRGEVAKQLSAASFQPEKEG
jgi:O-succinylbenzoic acid--CoA ligase